MTSNFHNDEAVGRNERLQPYTKPVLQKLGSVKEMTKAGTSGGSECGNSGAQKFCAPSDRRLKENIIEIGRHPLGIGIYLFDYKSEWRIFGKGRQFGVMADEVEAVLPEAVLLHPTGYKMVDYSMLGMLR